MTNIILGAGITGLTLSKQDKDSIVIGMRSHTAQTFKKDNYVFDRGIHCVNTLHESMPNMEQTIRCAKIDIGEKFVDYPYQVGRIDNYIEYSDNYEDYLVKRFGSDAMDFHIPYAMKFWGISPDKMSSDWCSTAQMPKGMGANSSFYYPNGGIEDIWEKLYKEVEDRVIFERVNYIDIKRKEVCFGGHTLKYDKLYNTIPLKEFGKLLNCPEIVDVSIRSLKTTEMYIHTMSIDTEKLDSKLKYVHWVYSSDDSIPFIRFSIPTNWNRNLSPKGKSIVQYELPKNDEKFIDELKDSGYELIHSDHLEYAYCIPLLEDKMNLEVINEWSEKNGIYHRGRFARHINIWIHQCMNEKL